MRKSAYVGVYQLLNKFPIFIVYVFITD